MTDPKVGSRDQNGATRVTAVTLTGTVITVSVVADGPAICTPDDTQPPVTERAWSGNYPVRAEYRRLVEVPLRPGLSGPNKAVLRPRTFQRDPDEQVTGIRWKQFGGKVAIGRGKLRQGLLHGCKRGLCAQSGMRIQLVASKPGYCQDSGQYEYTTVTGSFLRRSYFGRRLYFGTPTGCDPGH